MISIALKTLGAVLVGTVWIAEQAQAVPPLARIALLVVGVLVGYAAVRAERVHRGGVGRR